MYAWDTPRCPACSRPRHHLSNTQVCPVCGCPPYVRVEVLRFPQPARVVFIVVGVVLCGAALTGRDWGRWTPPTLLALGVLVLLTQWFILRRPRRAALWDEGLAVFEGRDVVCRLNAAQISSVRLDEVAEAVVLVLNDAPILEIPAVFFGAHARALDFVEAVRRQMAAL
ncbi:MAG: hypothetical protein H6816_06190 [Phycisphaerales bacterium]|nr:hypothetical protein [Phycisphaerales bacterium]